MLVYPWGFSEGLKTSGPTWQQCAVESSPAERVNSIQSLKSGKLGKSEDLVSSTHITLISKTPKNDKYYFNTLLSDTPVIKPLESKTPTYKTQKSHPPTIETQIFTEPIVKPSATQHKTPITSINQSFMVRPLTIKKHRRGKRNSLALFTHDFKWVGNNINGAKSKWASVKRWVRVKKPSILSLQETKFQVMGKHKLDGYITFEHLRSEKTAGVEFLWQL